VSMLNEEVAARLAGHLRNDTTDLAASDLHVPISHFVSQERAAAEREAIRKVPLIVARGSEIAEPRVGRLLRQHVPAPRRPGGVRVMRQQAGVHVPVSRLDLRTRGRRAAPRAVRGILRPH